MSNNVVVKLKKDEIWIELNEKVAFEKTTQVLKEKIEELKKFYKDATTPIVVTGANISNEEFEKIKEMIREKIDVEVTYKKPETMGLHSIKSVFEKEMNESNTKFIKGSLRSGQKEEYTGSIVIMGDVNSGAEIIAEDNVVILGALRGIAHAGAKGNRKAFIAAQNIDAPQIRIANVVTGFEGRAIEDTAEYKLKYAYVQGDEIVVEQVVSQK